MINTDEQLFAFATANLSNVKRFMMNTEKIKLLKELILCIWNIKFWDYDYDLNCLNETDEQDDILEYLLHFTNGDRTLREYVGSGMKMPLLLTDEAGIMWICVFHPEESRILTAGPFFMNESSHIKLTSALENSSLLLKDQFKIRNIIGNIPILPNSDVFEYAILMHYCVTGERITIADMHYSDRKELYTVADDFQEAIRKDVEHRGVYAAEQKLFDAIRSGNPNYHQALANSARFSHGIRAKNKDSLRNAKNSVILFTGLCSRAAIDGGLPPALSYQLCDMYVELTENCSSMSELAALNHRMVEDYVQRIRRYRMDTGISKAVQSCCDYIDMHVTDRLTISDLASYCGYTDYYLSRKFKKEVGMSPADYINRAKVDHARLLLTSTQASIQEISETLQFCSRSYFTSVFQNITGESPTEYRMNHHSINS